MTSHNTRWLLAACAAALLCAGCSKSTLKGSKSPVCTGSDGLGLDRSALTRRGAAMRNASSDRLPEDSSLPSRTKT